jgi:hypothetical protein
MSRPLGSAHGWDMEQCVPGVCNYDDRSADGDGSELYCVGELPKLVTAREAALEAELAEAKAQIANQVKLIERFSNAEAERDQLRELARDAFANGCFGFFGTAEEARRLDDIMARARALGVLEAGR